MINKIKSKDVKLKFLINYRITNKFSQYQLPAVVKID